MKLWISAAAVLALAGGAGLAQETKTTTSSGTAAGEAMPELPVAEWNNNGPVSLEDFRGQLTAVVFYDDNES
jgi:hypothetical protein